MKQEECIRHFSKSHTRVIQTRVVLHKSMRPEGLKDTVSGTFKML